MKLLGSLIASAALTFSVLVAVPAPATAAYPGTVATRCFYATPGAVKRNRNYSVGYSARANGNARPSGKVVFTVWRVRNDQVVKLGTYANGYTGPGYRRTSLGSFAKKGRYMSQLEFVPNSGSVYRGCSSGLRPFRVTR